jgi:hypothetical protein
LKNTDLEATDELEKQRPRRGRALRIRLPRGRHASPWTSRALVFVSVIGLLLLAPLWLDPVTFNQLRNVTPEPRPSASVPPAYPIPVHPTVAAPLSIVALDSFERKMATGLGRAETGGQYEIRGDSGRISVANGAATIQLVTGQAGEARLPEIDAHQADLTLLIDSSTRPAQGDAQICVVLRALDDGSEYRATVHLSPADSAALSVEARSSSDSVTVAGPIVVPGAGAGLMRVRATVEGSDPATIRMRAWMTSDPEPDFWHLSIVDWTGNLQAAGSVGIAWSLDGDPSGRPLTLRFDDLAATSADEVAR